MRRLMPRPARRNCRSARPRCSASGSALPPHATTTSPTSSTDRTWMTRSLPLRRTIAAMACTSEVARPSAPGRRPRGSGRTPRWRRRFPRHPWSREPPSPRAGSCAAGPPARFGVVPQRGVRGSRRGIVRAMRLPFEPPVEPMLAKASSGLPDGRRLAVRAQVGRLPRDRVPRRRRALHPEPRPEAARSLLPRARGAAPANLPERCVLDGEVVIAGDGALDFEALLLRIHPAASRVKMLAEQSPAVVRRLGPARARRRGPPRRAPGASAARGSSRRSPACEPPIHLTPATSDRDLAADWFDRFEGAGLDGVVAKRARRAVPAGQARDAQDQARAHRGLRRRRVPLAQERARARTSARCCSGCSTTRASCTTSGVTARSRGTGARRSARSWRRSARARSTATRGASGPSGRPPAPPTLPGSGCPARRAAGTAARTCRGSRCGRSSSSRSRSTISRATGSATRTTFQRWRPDKPPEDCRYEQLERASPFELARIFGGE